MHICTLQLLLEELTGDHPEFLENPELLLLLEPELPLFEPELCFLLSIWLLGFIDLMNWSALLELAVFSWLISE